MNRLDPRNEPPARLVTAGSITGLSPALLPRHHFGRRRWYKAGGPWHYHGPGDPLPARFDRRFYRQLDPALRPLCRLLYRLKLTTTPSCEGHFMPAEHFAAIWHDLHREAEQIRTRGLLVRDSATGWAYRFHDPAYELPWPEPERFCREVMAQQHEGYLGVVIPQQQPSLRHRLLAACGEAGHLEPGFDGPRGLDLLAIEVATDHPRRQARAWSHLAASIRRTTSTG